MSDKIILSNIIAKFFFLFLLFTFFVCYRIFLITPQVGVWEHKYETKDLLEEKVTDPMKVYFSKNLFFFEMIYTLYTMSIDFIFLLFVLCYLTKGNSTCSIIHISSLYLLLGWLKKFNFHTGTFSFLFSRSIPSILITDLTEPNWTDKITLGLPLVFHLQFKRMNMFSLSILTLFLILIEFTFSSVSGLNMIRNFLFSYITAYILQDFSTFMGEALDKFILPRTAGGIILETNE